MKVLLDTSVLVAGMVEAHPYHAQGMRWLKRVIQGEIQGIVAAHTLAELYAVLTALPVEPRIAPYETGNSFATMYPPILRSSL